MKPPVVIDNERKLEKLVNKLKKETLLGVDTESDSYYSYQDRICIIQISTQEEDYIVDNIALKNIEALRTIFENRKIEKIFHDCTNDIAGLKADFGFHCKNIFDTAIAWRMISGEHRGLAFLLEMHFGFYHNKKFQKWDWRRRPLQQEQLEYARIDTHFLIPLRNMLYSELESKGLLQKFKGSVKNLENLEKTPKRFNPNGYWRLKGAQNLDPKSLDVLKALYRYRERTAERLNKAAFRIINGETMIRLARKKPKTLQEIKNLKGLPRHMKKQGAKDLLNIIKKATSEHN
ncbi:MAG TPA: hypothetical protein ENG51_04250 [Deltaproteobacteria bacterium]|nr:MAG: hypothetical protein DRG83_14765 [Deltaproteobacteria bacterium]HDM75665.1 hypothetical protein [Deltaproteobacteria bacterium]